MNDQRQVIFYQRLNILKKSNIEELLNDFLEELLKKIIKFKADYKTSNDKNFYLTNIKNFTGNAILDEELVELTSKSDADFSNEIKKIYKLKREEKVKLIGKNQYDDLEKKIFLQILDFSWRSHLQYLEQLRQVIGLRSYGQKDPLSEFKKEAFVLFEGLLLKIKNDLIKFLLNLNIVVSSEEAKKEENAPTKEDKSDKKVGRNEKCPCGSGKKFKYCHGNV